MQPSGPPHGDFRNPDVGGSQPGEGPGGLELQNVALGFRKDWPCLPHEQVSCHVYCPFQSTVDTALLSSGGFAG